MLSGSAVMVCPYVDATQSAVVLTAYGFDLPVIATRVGAMPEYIVEGKTGILVEPSDPAALAEAIISLLRDHPRRCAMRNAIRDMKRNALSWESAAQSAMAIYRSLLQESVQR